MTDADFNLLDLYAGGGGFHLAAEIAGFYFKKVYYSEINPYANKIYKSRFPSAVALGDVRRVTRRSCAVGGRWIITAGFPCQPFSVAGNQLGINDDRYHWHQVIRIAKAFRPDGFIFENVAGIESVPFAAGDFKVESRSRLRTPESDRYHSILTQEEDLQLGKCLQDLEEAGAVFQTFDIPALGVNAWHKRRRIWIVGSFTDFDNSGRKNGRREKLESNKKRRGENFRPAITEHSAIDDSDNHEKRELQPQGRVRKFGRRSGNGHSLSNADAYKSRCQKQQQSEQVETQHAGTEHGFGNDSDIEILGQQEQGIGEPLRFRETNRFNAHLEWRRHWFEVAAGLCRSDDGLSRELDVARLRNDIAGLYPEASEKDIARALSKLETEYRRARIELLGNSIVPQIPVEFFKIFKEIWSAENSFID